MNPTHSTYNGFQTAYDRFNAELFDGKLPACLITLRAGRAAYGHFSPNRFENNDGEHTDEIAMNPKVFSARDDKDVLSTLVHEMTHVEQQHFGKPSRNGYHNKEWGTYMDRVGLTPSNTGKPGGKRTGQQMTHYIVDDGPFAKAWVKLEAEGFKIDWAEAPTLTLSSSRMGPKFICPECHSAARGKKKLNLICGDCHVPMEYHKF